MIVKTSNNGPLNLRAEPNTNSPVLARIPNGTKVTLSPCNEKWGKTTYNDKEGYVMLSYLVEETVEKTITKDDLQKIYDSLKTTLTTIESVLK